jgi:hypothetical protein
MQRLTLDAIHHQAAPNLEDSLRHFDDTPCGLAREFVDLKLHACIFQYDVCTEIITFVGNKPTDFASAASLKSLILRLYE